jgi:hypothetical protein
MALAGIRFSGRSAAACAAITRTVLEFQQERRRDGTGMKLTAIANDQGQGESSDAVTSASKTNGRMCS